MKKLLVPSIQITPFVALLLLGAFILMQTPSQDVDAASFIPVKQRMATTTVVGPDTTVTLFSARTSCTSRVISTVDGSNTPINFLTGDPSGGDLSSTTLALSNGLYQAGS